MIVLWVLAFTYKKIADEMQCALEKKPWPEGGDERFQLYKKISICVSTFIAVAEGVILSFLNVGIFIPSKNIAHYKLWDVAAIVFACLIVGSEMFAGFIQISSVLKIKKLY